LLADFTELHLEPLAMRVFAAAHREHHEGVTFELAGRLTKFVQDMQLILSEVQTYVAKIEEATRTDLLMIATGESPRSETPSCRCGRSTGVRSAGGR
jgi:hypothetical protein